MGRAGDDGMARLGVVPRGGGVARSFARSFMRVGACADELRLMGVIRVVEVAARGRAGAVVVPWKGMHLGPRIRPGWIGCGQVPGGTGQIEPSTGL